MKTKEWYKKNVHVFKWCVRRSNRVEKYKELETKNKEKNTKV